MVAVHPNYSQIVTNMSILMCSVLELENALGGDPGPGLGADSDFDKSQLEKVFWSN